MKVACIAMLAFLQGTAMGASINREYEEKSWVDMVMNETTAAMGATAWKAPTGTEGRSATRLEQSKTGMGISRTPAITATAAAERINYDEEYIPVARANPAWKRATAAPMPVYSRLINTEEVKDETKTVTVGRVRPGKKRPTVSRIYPEDEEQAGSQKVLTAKVVSAINQEPGEASPPPVIKPVQAVSSTKSAPKGGETSPALKGLAQAAVPPPPPPPPVKVIKAAPPASSTQAVTPHPPADPAKAVSASQFMSSRKPAPVVEEAPPPAPVKPKEEKKTGVPVSPDAQTEFLSEMVVVSPSGRTIRMTYYMRAKELLKEGDFTEAEKSARAWLETNPEDWRGWQLLGNIQVELGAYGKALKSYKKSLNLHPDNDTLRHYVNQAEGIEEN